MMHLQELPIARADFLSFTFEPPDFLLRYPDDHIHGGLLETLASLH
jgi:hypothetical protein